MIVVNHAVTKIGSTADVIVVSTLQRLAEREVEEGVSNEGRVPFSLMATQYRRKRLMSGIIHGDKEVMLQVTQLSERQAAEAVDAAARAAKAAEMPSSPTRNAEVEVRAHACVVHRQQPHCSRISPKGCVG